MKKWFICFLGCLLCLFIAVGSCEEFERKTIEWEEITVTVVGLSEKEELSKNFDPAEGKWITLVLRIDGETKMDPLAEMLREKFRLDEMEPYSGILWSGASVRYEGTETGAVEVTRFTVPGSVKLCFDVPKDYELEKAVLFFDGELVETEIDPEDILD